MQMFGSRKLRNRIMAAVLALAMLAVVIPVGSLAEQAESETFDANFKGATLDDLNSKLNFYRADKIRTKQELLTDAVAASAGWGRAFSPASTGVSYLFAPKDQAGADAKLKNFEAHFASSMLQTERMILTFRSSAISEVYNDGTTEQMVSLIVSRRGYRVVDTAVGDLVEETPWSNGAVDPPWCLLDAKVVGNKLTFKVTYTGTDPENADTSDDMVIAEKEVTLSTDRGGYFNLSLEGGWIGFRYLNVVRLDDSGNKIDWNAPTGDSAQPFVANFKGTSLDKLNTKLSTYEAIPLETKVQPLTDKTAVHADWGRMIAPTGAPYVFAPKDRFGAEVKLKNFEMQFSSSMLATEKMALTFRSATSAKDHSEYDPSQAVTLITSRKGYQIVDAAGGVLVEETPWDDDVIDPPWCIFTVKVVGNKMTFKGIYAGTDPENADTSDDKVIAEKEVTLSTDNEGYFYLVLRGSWIGLRYLNVTKLDDNGDVIDWNDGVVEETHTSFTAPLKESYTDPAAIDKTVNVYYDQSRSKGGEHKLIHVDSIADNAANEKYGGFYDTTYTKDYNAWPLIMTRNWPNADNAEGLLMNTTSYVPKLSDGKTEAKLKNFETNFQLQLFNANRMGVALSFRSDKAGAMLNDAGDGGYANNVTLLFNQSGWSIYDGESLDYDEADSTKVNRWTTGETLESATPRVYVKVVGQQLTVKVDVGNRILYDNSASPYELKTSGAGYLYWSMVSNWTWAGSMECNRLDAFGKQIDWDDESGNATERKMFLNAFETVEAIDKGVDVYYDQSTEQNTRKFAKMDSIADNAADAKYGLPFETNWIGAWPKIQTTNRTGRLLNNSTTFVPKLSDGVTPAKLENFETAFSPLIFEGDQNMGFAISFRSDKPGVMLDDKGHEGYSNKVTLFMNCKGWQIYDGTAMSYANPNVNTWPAELTGAPVIDIYLKVVGNKMIFRAFNGTEVLYDNSNDPYTLEMSGPGYIYYSYVTNWTYVSSPLVCKRLDSNGEMVDWDVQREGKVTITKVDCPTELTFDRSKDENYRLPKFLTGTDAEGFTYSIPVTWENSEYRSYKSGKFTFTGKLAATEDYDVSGIGELKLTVNNITNEVMTADGKVASKTWYFDTESDLADFTCRKVSSFDLNDDGNDVGSDWHTVSLSQVDTANYWKIENGRAASSYDRKIVGWEGDINGVIQATDATTMLLDKDLTNSLINYQIEVDYYGCGAQWRQPHVIFGVQDPSEYIGDIYATSLSDKETGANTGLHGNSKGGTAVYIQDCYPQYRGIVQSIGAFTMFYDADFSEGKTTIEKYSSRDSSGMFVKHTMKVNVCGSDVYVQIDDSDRYYASLPDDVSGGYVGFGSWGSNVIYDNLRIIAIDAQGEPMSYADAEKGITPVGFVDNYTGWRPSYQDIDFIWSDKYYY